MRIYVQSRGKPQNKDYTWLKAEKNRLYREIPPILKRIQIAELIDSRKYSIIVARDDGELVLLVTGLSSQRNDFMNRRIRNSVAWVVDDNLESEEFIRSLAVCVLTDREKVENEVNEAVNETVNQTETDSDYEFKVNSEKINRLSDFIKVESYSDPDEYNYIGSDSIELQQEVGLELQTNALPNRDGILVLLTSLKTESALKQYKVWRGLSAKVPYNKLTLVSSNKEEKKKVTHRNIHNPNSDNNFDNLKTSLLELFYQLEVNKIITDQFISKAKKGKLGDKELSSLHECQDKIQELKTYLRSYKKEQNLDSLYPDSNQTCNPSNNNVKELINNLKEKLNTTSKKEVYKEDQMVIKTIDDVIESLYFLIKDIIETNQNSKNTEPFNF